MSFDEDIALDADGNGAIADGWMTARGPHGGYVMAILAQAMERAAGRQARSLTVHFLRPPAIGPVQTQVTVERAGRSMSTVTGRLEQDGKPVALGLGAYAGAYDAPDVGELPMPDVPPPSAEQEPLPGAPPFTHQMIMQPRFGAAPFTGADASVVGGWIGFRDGRPLDGPAMCVMADGYYPAIWPRLTALHPAPTIDLTVHFRAPLPVTGPLLARFTSKLARDGYFEEDGELWTADGTLVAQSRQLALLLPALG
ncbi:thioesterase family protein [Solirubrobacter phytolaccae]|uniref:Thioesterase family protein n=1 Tax=Solirubrobacter phytolaccae TaxID=1404360 RepID=A0A9X3SC54_9ACTN|nr:thioesterase family protein [Solirubrobacter phytolaccae]MDA0185433.1 thioesterase family protein [Solirubrobacter phytolaccae]